MSFFSEIFKITKQTKIVVAISAILTAIIILVGFLYYKNTNNSEDPRLLNAKRLLNIYQKLIEEKKITEALIILDSIKNNITSINGYANSFEVGIIYNNKASILISEALYFTNIDSIEKQQLLNQAKLYIDSAIFIYEHWLAEYSHLSNKQIRTKIQPFFQTNDTAFKNKNLTKIIDKRIKDIILAKKETTRRLSVAYTNSGIIQRHNNNYDEAIKCYINAIKLWNDNYTARDNLSVLLGKTPKGRSFFQKLFPPDRYK